MTSPVPVEKLKFYGQHGEDQLLWEFFDRKPTGSYIDVGAFDGVYLSNTYSFYQQGWRGICIEPHPRYYELLRRNRPDDTCINAACTDQDDASIDFRADVLGLYSTASSEPELLSQIEQRYRKNAIPFQGLEVNSIPTITLGRAGRMLLERVDAIDFVNIDVEGLEMLVIAGASAVRPRVFVIEENDQKSRDAVAGHVVGELGYVLARTLGINSLYTRTPEDAVKLRAIPIRCAIEKALHPMGAEFTLAEYRNGHIIDEEASRKAQQLDQASQERVQLDRRLQHLSGRIEELNAARDAGVQRAGRLERENLHLRSRIDEVEAQANHLRRQLASARSTLESMELEVQEGRRTRSRLEQVSARKEELEKRIQGARAESEALSARLEASQRTIQEMSDAYRLGFALKHPWRILRSRLQRPTRRAGE